VIHEEPDISTASTQPCECRQAEKEILGHREFVNSLCELAATAAAPGLLASVRGIKLAGMLAKCLMAKNVAPFEVDDQFVARLSSALSVKWVTDDFLADEPTEPFSALEYAIEIAEVLAEWQRLQVVGYWMPSPFVGRYFQVDRRQEILYQRIRIYGGQVIETSASPNVRAVHSNVTAALPACMSSCIDIRVIVGAKTFVSEKFLGLGDWQSRSFCEDCRVELVTIGPYVVFGHRRMPSANKCE